MVGLLLWLSIPAWAVEPETRIEIGGEFPGVDPRNLKNIVKTCKNWLEVTNDLEQILEGITKDKNKLVYQNTEPVKPGYPTNPDKMFKQTFEGTIKFVGSFGNMAIISDDGCTVSVKEHGGVDDKYQPYIKKFETGQALTAAAFATLPIVFKRDTLYDVKVEYCQSDYNPKPGKFDIDGATLYASMTQFDLPPIEIKQPIINADGSSGELEAVQEVRMCRWNSPRHAVIKDTLDKIKEFPASDPDQIVILIPFTPGSGEKIVHVSTKGASGAPGGENGSYNDSGADITLKEGSTPGIFKSEPIVLVADQNDDRWANGRATDGAKHDPTFIGWPGGKLVIKAPFLNNTTYEFQIKKFSHKFKVSWGTAGNMAGANCPNAMVNSLIRLPEIYAPIHEQVELEHAQTVFSEADVQSIIGDGTVTDADVDALTAKVDALGLPADVIKVIFVSKDAKRLGLLGEMVGETIWRDDKLGEIVFVYLHALARDAVTAYQLAPVVSHECGHILRGAGHTETAGVYTSITIHTVELPKYNLMATGGGNNIIDGSPEQSGKHWYVKDTDVVHQRLPYSRPAQ